MDDPSSLEAFGNVSQAGFNSFGDVVSILILLCLLMSSALISGSEAAFFSLTPVDKEDLKADSGKSAKTVTDLLKKPKELLATILIANNFVNVAIVIVSSAVLTQAFEGSELSGTTQFLIEFAAITLALLLIGEVIPKIYATKRALFFTKMMSKPLYYLNKTPPISWIRSGLVLGTSFIQKRGKRGKVDLSTGELEQALALTKETSTSDDDHKILEGIVKFGSTEVRQIMKSRVDVHSLESEDTFETVLEKILDCGHSRIPVYEDNFDKIIGILFIKDLLPHLSSKEKFNWKELIRKPFFVTENRKIDDLLKDFQEKKVHIAMVVDEYGGTSGIVTLEDVLEEIVGDITDEFDDDEIVYTKINESTYLFEGKTSLVDFYKVMDIDEEELEIDTQAADTIGGLAVEIAGRILEPEESLVIGNFKLIVESSDKKRIKMIKAVKIGKED
jgi:gliding motility-associated protein GldE